MIIHGYKLCILMYAFGVHMSDNKCVFLIYKLVYDAVFSHWFYLTKSVFVQIHTVHVQIVYIYIYIYIYIFYIYIYIYIYKFNKIYIKLNSK